MNTSGSNSGKWIERAITLVLIVLSSFSGYLIDKTRMEDRLTAVEEKAEENEAKLDEANLELILYRINAMETTMVKLEGSVTKLDEKIDASTRQILDRINDRRR